MILTIPYPNIDPVFLRIGPIQLRWYGLMYMLSFIIGFFILRRFARYRKLNLSTDDLYDLLFYLILGAAPFPATSRGELIREGHLKTGGAQPAPPRRICSNNK